MGGQRGYSVAWPVGSVRGSLARQASKRGAGQHRAPAGHKPSPSFLWQSTVQGGDAFDHIVHLLEDVWPVALALCKLLRWCCRRGAGGWRKGHRFRQRRNCPALAAAKPGCPLAPSMRQTAWRAWQPSCCAGAGQHTAHRGEINVGGANAHAMAPPQAKAHSAAAACGTDARIR